MTVDFDIIICGGGFAGLTLARQIRLEVPHLRIAVLDAAERPVPVAAHKVGESTVELATLYLRDILGLKDYMNSKHLPKYGLRFFFGKGTDRVDQRPEFGGALWPPIVSYQIDRGVFENDLWEMNAGDGVTMMSGTSVKKVNLGKDGAPHVVECVTQVYGAEGQYEEPRTLSCRWVIDALGRRRLLTTALGLRADSGHRANAVWFRVKGRLDVEDMATDPEWLARVPHRERWLSTNHFMGRGYWVWFIPLISGYHSVGIVVDGKLHPFETIGTWEKTQEWLQKHEPHVYEYLKDREVVDYAKMKNYSHSTGRIISGDRWACIGDAGLFTDPFYSPGSDVIAMENSLICALLRHDQDPALPRIAEYLNNALLSTTDGLFDLYRDQYPIWENAHVMTAKVVWDWAIYWALAVPLFTKRVITSLDRNVTTKGDTILRRFRAIQRSMQPVFRDWNERYRPGMPNYREPYTFAPPLAVTVLRELLEALDIKETPAEAFARILRDVDLCERIAKVMFMQAVEDCYPEARPRLDECDIDPTKLVLDPAKWESSGMLLRDRPPEDLETARQVLLPLFGDWTNHGCHPIEARRPRLAVELANARLAAENKKSAAGG